MGDVNISSVRQFLSRDDFDKQLASSVMNPKFDLKSIAKGAIGVVGELKQKLDQGQILTDADKKIMRNVKTLSMKARDNELNQKLSDYQSSLFKQAKQTSKTPTAKEKRTLPALKVTGQEIYKTLNPLFDENDIKKSFKDGTIVNNLTSLNNLIAKIGKLNENEVKDLEKSISEENDSDNIPEGADIVENMNDFVQEVNDNIDFIEELRQAYVDSGKTNENDAEIQKHLKSLKEQVEVLTKKYS